MSTSNQLTTNSQQTYNKVELAFIFQEFKRLQDARQEFYSERVLEEWVKSFWGERISANVVCKMICSVRTKSKVYGKLTLSDIINADIEDMPDIVNTHSQINDNPLMVLCCRCGRATTVKKKDALSFDRNIKCPNSNCRNTLHLEKLKQFARECIEMNQHFYF